jgi:hypothetical protein
MMIAIALAARQKLAGQVRQTRGVTLASLPLGPSKATEDALDTAGPSTFVNVHPSQA